MFTNLGNSLQCNSEAMQGASSSANEKSYEIPFKTFNSPSALEQNGVRGYPADWERETAICPAVLMLATTRSCNKKSAIFWEFVLIDATKEFSCKETGKKIFACEK